MPKPYSGPERRKPILVVQHAPHEHPAAFLRGLETQGILTQWIHVYRGESFPDVSTIGGMISLGGPMSANDDDEHPWIPSECEMLKSCVKSGLPVVGICLGGQLLARALGGRVEKHHVAEVGWHPLVLNGAGIKDPVVGAAGENPVVYQWHGDTFFLPPEAELLARSKHCERQAYRIGEKIYGFQFHPEADHQLVHEWLAIEGVEEEVEAAMVLHGTHSIQDLETQRSHSLQGERSSLKITAAAAALFRQRPVQEVSQREISEYSQLAKDESNISIEFEGSQRKPVRLKGRVATVLSIPAGNFVIFRQENSLLWPIRIDDIVNFTKVKSE